MAQLPHKIDKDLDEVIPTPLVGDVLSIKPVPHISLHAFCASEPLFAAIESAVGDRRLARVRTDLHRGNISDATEVYRFAPTPDLLILQAGAQDHDRLVAELSSLASVCDATTKVVLVGLSNDIALYRRLLALGIAEYLLAPLSASEIIALVARLYHHEGASKLGRSYAFIGAAGGVGSSTLAQNVAWTLSRSAQSDVMLADLDLAFGIGESSFNLEPGRGAIEAVEGAERLDTMLLERMLVKCDKHLKLLYGGGELGAASRLSGETFEKVIDVAQSLFPTIVLDLAHGWTAANREALLAADEIVITAQPDLVNLRNVKGLVDFLRQSRPNDRPPRLVLNQVRMPKRMEIQPKEFAQAVGLEAAAVIRFDPASFSGAATKGQMLGQYNRKAAACGEFEKIANALTRRQKAGPRGLFGFIRRSVRRFSGALRSDERGLSAVEFALLAPLLLLGLLATADLGFAQSRRMSIDHVLRAAAQSAIADPGEGSVLNVATSTATPEFSLAADPAAPGPGELGLAISRLAACPEHTDTAVPVSTTCAGGQPTMIYYALSAKMTYAGMILPDLPLTSALQVRVR